MSGNLYFTSDLHLGHARVAALRGFVDGAGEADTAAHDQAILDNWRNVVGKADTVWVLGDLATASSRQRLAVILAQIDELPGTKHLITGNHDPVSPVHRDAHRWQPVFSQTFASVQPFARRRIAGHDALLSHFPYAGDHTGTDRYTQYRLPDEGRWLLHGHTHSPDRISGRRQIHVGLDAWGLRPVSLATIEAIIASDGRAVRVPGTPHTVGT